MTAGDRGTPSAAPAEFRRAMTRWATGVSVVTSRNGSVDAGLTVNALLSVSLDPPLLLVSINEVTDTAPIVRASGIFAASFLAADQRDVSERFARTISLAEKFGGLPVHRGETGAPLVDGAIGYVECRVRSTTPAADHLLFLGDVVRVAPGRPALPLVFFGARYAAADGPDRLKLTTPSE